MKAAVACSDSRRLTAALLLVVVSAFTAIPASGGTLYVEFHNDGLENLGHGWAYEGWLIVDGMPVSSGVFTVGDDGAPMPSRFAVEVDDSSTVTTFVLTIEPVPDLDPGPSAVHVLAGDFAQGMAELSAGHGAALGDDFSAAMGSYILSAPSGGGAADYFNGIWWLDPDAGPGPSLDLPALPEGWVFEGWVVGDGGPTTTGRFSDPAAIDFDGAGITGGPFAGPPFPGQDYVVQPIDLTSGYAAVLSIEPEPDNSPAPFAFKPLVDGNIDDVGAGILQAMGNNAAAFPTATVTMSEAMAGETAHLMLDFDGLEDLGPDFAYEGWLIVDGAPVSTGTFTVDGGVPSDLYFPTMVSSVNAASAFVLTIEPVPDGDPAPSSVHILAGDLIGGRAGLTVDHGAALGTGFADAMGSYILSAPSGGGSVPYTHGIWWLDPMTGPGPTLDLPELPDGWVYEGWVAGEGGPMSTGRFSSASGADDDGAGATGGPDPFPPFPGQDFVMPPTDLTSGYAAVISVEPEPDNSAGPFTLKPLMDPVIDDVGAGVLQPMHLNLGSLPTGTAVIAEPSTVVVAGSTTGFGGVQWRTDLFVGNDGVESATILLQLLRSNQSNTTPETMMFTLGAGDTVRYMDALMSVFGAEGTAAVRVLSDVDAVRSTSRSFAVAADGSYGQGVPAFDPDQALRFGDYGRLLQLAENDAFRTNLGFVNATGMPVTVFIELFVGNTVHSGSIVLQPYEHLQLNRVFPEDVDVGWARVSTSTPGGAFFAYATVVDNGVHDSTFVIAQ